MRTALTTAVFVVCAATVAEGACERTPGVRNNPAFSSHAALGTADPCKIAPLAARPAPKRNAAPSPRPEERTVTALDLATSRRSEPEVTVERDEAGRTVLRSGNTEVRISASLRFEVSSRLGGRN